MRLEDYWGVGPKTSDLLADELGTEAAMEAIESADVDALVAAGLARGRATRILRHVHGADGMATLTTSDTRSVYKDLLDRIGTYAVTDRAHDRIRVLTPLTDFDAMNDRLDAITDAMAVWETLSESERETVRDAFAADAADPDRAAVETARALQSLDVSDGPFAPIAALDADALNAAAAALATMEGGRIGEGADDELDTYRERLAAVEDLAGRGLDVLDDIQGDGIRNSEQFQAAFVEYVADATGVPPSRVREAAPDGATDAPDYVGEGLRTLADDLRDAVDDRIEAVRVDIEATMEATGDTVTDARTAVSDAALYCSLARFAIEYDLGRPAFTEEQTVAARSARNLALAGNEGDVQPVTYAVGSHDLDAGRDVPTDDQVTVLTGANSGGKTTLLETLCQITLLAHMGLPVPAEDAIVGPFDSIVFHRRHASFNAGVLETTLKTIVPPLTREGETLMLVDEFEAITEPGRAADILHGLVNLTVDAEAAGVFVTHLADDLEPLPETARLDGIFAEGLTEDLTLDVDYQPRFGTVGKSTPEFIISRLVANARDRRERAGFEALASAIGEETVQRTLADAEWGGTSS
jgi:hypothetical protein